MNSRSFDDPSDFYFTRSKRVFMGLAAARQKTSPSYLAKWHYKNLASSDD